MSRDTVIAKRYAQALYDVASTQNLVAEVRQQLELIAGALASDGDVSRFLSTPGIEPSVKLDIIKKAIGDRVSSIVLNTVTLLIERGRQSSVGSVSEAYGRIADEASGESRATVYTAIALSEAELAKVLQQFGVIAGRRIIGEQVVEPSLLGGIKVRIGDKIYDGSLSTKLDRLSKQINSQAL
ncbi:MULTISPECIES: F0F1 ATP synthase subunit delta [unclassified Paenibacillus]|uniref:F0F1 ATP synthase subunit delta n=1 Tax=unclassified Paenibacillus TaxID=185978 RepID=UPI0009568F85|nr:MULTISPECIES: F0F1 ATP synthase subunit delta [unclassified Paenibacillus]ASS67283.1 F0F1 ATP synthase subunit delta [Paenibacillus sp. RUD330]SIQ82775.1 F-type H+-transporting ATPase subunit delta [Paenibacillus sp. RU4X]SIR04080.1 F-type H+-transporting ATPase subunit delta [Paenibacillus sp. RU4T]